MEFVIIIIIATIIALLGIAGIIWKIRRGAEGNYVENHRKGL